MRCAATNVNPETALRDMTVTRTLEQAFGVNQFGIYAEVLTPGTLTGGDAVEGPWTLL